MTITQHLVAIRGDHREITLTMPDGAQLTQAESVTFYAREDVDDTDAVWEQELTPSSDTVAVATLDAAEWTAWEEAGEPRVLQFAFRVVNADSEPHTPALGTITVVSSAA